MAVRNQDLSTKFIAMGCYQASKVDRAGSYTHIHTCMYKCKYIHTYIHTHMYIHLHIYQHLFFCLYLALSTKEFQSNTTEFILISFSIFVNSFSCTENLDSLYPRHIYSFVQSHKIDKVASELLSGTTGKMKEPKLSFCFFLPVFSLAKMTGLWIFSYFTFCLAQKVAHGRFSFVLFLTTADPAVHSLSVHRRRPLPFDSCGAFLQVAIPPISSILQYNSAAMNNFVHMYFVLLGSRSFLGKAGFCFQPWDQVVNRVTEATWCGRKPTIGLGSW